MPDTGGFFERVADTVAGFFRRGRAGEGDDFVDPYEKGVLAYRLNRWELYTWRAAMATLGVESRTVETWMDKRPEWPLLARELFGRLYTGDELPEVLRPAEWAQRVHDTAGDLPEFARLLDLCRDSRLDAGVAAVALARRLEELIDPEDSQGLGSDEEPPPPSPSQAPADGSDSGGEGEGPGDDSEGNSGGAEGSQGDRGGPSDSALRQAIREACQDAADEVDQTREAMAALGVGWGSEIGSSEVHSSHEQVADLARRLREDRRLRAIAELAGRVEAIARQKAMTKVERIGAELADVGLGQDPRALLPSELALARRRVSRLDLLRRLANRSALVYEVEGEERLGKGPLVLCLDSSSSMSGDRDQWSKAIALALRNHAARERRDAHIVIFNGAVVSEYRENGDVAALLDVIDTRPSGGTSWTAALDRARELIDAGGDFAKADIVLVTDGECGVPDEWRKAWDAWRKDRVACLGVLIAEGYRYGGDRAKRALDMVCDTVAEVKPNEDKIAAARSVIEVAI